MSQAMSQAMATPASPPPLRPGAVGHGPGSEHVDSLLDRFTAELKRRGFRVGGVVQRNHGLRDDCAEQMELVDVATGRAFGISQNLGRESRACRVDPSGVADASQAIRRAVEERADLIVVNKCAGLEAHGEGLSAEMLSAITEGIPLLTSVGSRFINEWQVFAGGYADLRQVHTWNTDFVRSSPYGQQYEAVANEIERALTEGAIDADLIVTTGGTGFSPRDVTPEATQAVCERMVPGIPEAMRAASLKVTPLAMLSRAAAGICGNCLIVNLPGSVRAATENLEAVVGALGHGIEMLRGGDHFNETH